MAVDSGAAVLAKLVTVLEGVGTKDLGKVFDHMPIWRKPAEMTTNARVVIGGQPTHRFVSIQMATSSEAFTNGSDLVLHTFIVNLWAGALVDKNFSDISTATMYTLIGLTIAALRDHAVLNTGANFCGYPEDGLPKEVEPLEFRKHLGVIFHVATIGLTTREEISL